MDIVCWLRLTEFIAGQSQEVGEEEEDFRHLPDWKCKLCNFFNQLPPDDPEECNRCQHPKWAPRCCFHKGISSKSNDTCYNCGKHFKYSDPEYDAHTIILNCAKRALQVCINNNYLENTSYENPKDMMKELCGYEKKKSKDPEIFERCDEILWNACMIIDLKYIADDIGSMLNHIDDIEHALECYEMEYEEEKAEMKQQLEDLKNHPETFEVSGSKRGSKYLVNLEEGICTCPGFQFNDHCKHLRMKKKPKREEKKPQKAGKVSKSSGKKK